jgi:outer membrane protein TolC
MGSFVLELKVKKSELNSKIDSLYAKLSYLCAEDIAKLDISLEIKQLPSKSELQETLKNNLDIEIKNTEIQKQKTNLKLSDVNRYPDFMLIGGYSYRSKYDDFFNIGVGVTLPIYGTESSKYEEQKKLLLSKEADKKDTSIKIDNNFEIYFAQMQSAYDIYKILNDEALAQVAHMLDIIESSVSTGTNLLKQITILQKNYNLSKKV